MWLNASTHSQQIVFPHLVRLKFNFNEHTAHTTVQNSNASAKKPFELHINYDFTTGSLHSFPRTLMCLGVLEAMCMWYNIFVTHTWRRGACVSIFKLLLTTMRLGGKENKCDGIAPGGELLLLFFWNFIIYFGELSATGKSAIVRIWILHFACASVFAMSLRCDVDDCDIKIQMCAGVMNRNM